VLDYRDGARVEVAMTVSNHGRAPIELDAPEPYCRSCGLHFRTAYEVPEGGMIVPRGDPPVRFPLRIAANGSTSLQLVYALDDCEHYPAGSGVGLSGPTFPVRVLGVHHTVEVGDGAYFPLNIKFPRSCKA
jgi:hypothetical protein